MWFTRVSIGNPVLATMVMLAFVVLGLFSYQRLAVDQFPDIDFPTVVITVDYPGASPEIVETEVTKLVEQAVNTVAGIDTLFSRSYEGSSVTVVQPTTRAMSANRRSDAGSPSAPHSASISRRASDIAGGSCSSPIGRPSPPTGTPSTSLPSANPSRSISAVLTVMRCKLAWITQIGRIVDTTSRWWAANRSPGK